MSERATICIEELDCVDEVRTLRSQLEGRPGISTLDFDVVRGRMFVQFESEITTSEILSLVTEAGMHGRLEGEMESSTQVPSRMRDWMTVACGTLLAAGFATHAMFSGSLLAATGMASSPVPVLAQFFLGSSILLGLVFVVPKALASLRSFRADMNLLMCIAVFGAVALGEWLEAAVVTFLFNVALLLEHWSIGRARRAIAALMDLSPPTARYIDGEGGNEEIRPSETIRVGQCVAVRPGERIPLDGVVSKGESSVNQAPITGESIPVLKEPGSEVFAGTINEDGVIYFEVTRPANDSTLARIVHMVQESHASRAPAEQWVERFAHWYTPAMIALAIAIAILPPLFLGQPWHEWGYNALVLLVIACPCALVISTPVSIVSALTAAANNGVLIKGGRFLEAAARIRAIALDKTGTLTRGRPVVQSVVPLSEHSRAELLKRAAAMEAHSTHPIARAILLCADNDGISVDAADDHRILGGRGAEGTVDGRPFWIGSQRLMQERLPVANEVHSRFAELETAGNSVIAVGNEDHVCGLIGVADSVREEASEAIRNLKSLGVEHVAMLTGDNEETARTIAREVGVDAYFADLLPEDKVCSVSALCDRYGTVAMVGDGANDSPAMAASSIGIAMGAIGVDAAIEAADIALMSDDLGKLPWLITHARRTLRLIKQNIALALALKVMFVGLTILGIASLWAAIVADMGASLLVVFNGLRLLRTDR